MKNRLRSRDQTAKCGMAHEKFSSSEESTHEQIQGESYDYCFLRQPWHCAQRICTSGTDDHAFYKDVLERLRKRVQLVRTDIADDCCTTITRQFTLRFQFENFWRSKTFRTITSSLQTRSSSVRFLPLP